MKRRKACAQLARKAPIARSRNFCSRASCHGTALMSEFEQQLSLGIPLSTKSATTTMAATRRRRPITNHGYNDNNNNNNIYTYIVVYIMDALYIYIYIYIKKLRIIVCIYYIRHIIYYILYIICFCFN